MGLLLGLLLGAFVGSLAVMLFAPVTGKQLRLNIRGNFSRAREAAKAAEAQKRAELEAQLAARRNNR